MIELVGFVGLFRDSVRLWVWLFLVWTSMASWCADVLKVNAYRESIRLQLSELDVSEEKVAWLSAEENRIKNVQGMKEAQREQMLLHVNHFRFPILGGEKVYNEFRRIARNTNATVFTRLDALRMCGQIKVGDKDQTSLGHFLESVRLGRHYLKNHQDRGEGFLVVGAYGHAFDRYILGGRVEDARELALEYSKWKEIEKHASKAQIIRINKKVSDILARTKDQEEAVALLDRVDNDDVLRQDRLRQIGWYLRVHGRKFSGSPEEKKEYIVRGIRDSTASTETLALVLVGSGHLHTHKVDSMKPAEFRLAAEANLKMAEALRATILRDWDSWTEAERKQFSMTNVLEHTLIELAHLCRRTGQMDRALETYVEYEKRFPEGAHKESARFFVAEVKKHLEKPENPSMPVVIPVVWGLMLLSAVAFFFLIRRGRVHSPPPA